MDDSDIDLTTIDGVGPATVETLADNGFDSMQAVADAPTDDLEDALSVVRGFGSEQVAELQTRAQELAPESSDGETDEQSDDPETAELTITVDDVLFAHVLNVVLEEAVRMRQRNDVEKEAYAYGVVYDLLASRVDHSPLPTDPGSDRDAGAEYDLTLEIRARDADILHQALSAGVSNYRTLSGITGIWGDIDSVKEQVNTVRAEFR